LARQFVDTNIWVYAVDDADEAKQDRAREVLRRIEQAVVSAQVLNEFYTVVTRKLDRPMSPEQAAAAVEDMSQLLVVPVDRYLTLDAIALSRSHQLSLWDAAIVEAARSASCAEVLTEDLQDGRSFDGVVVRNPLAAPAA
jgi:predicted nucleic acid-binding protein